MIRIDDERGEKTARAPAEKIRIVTLCNSLLHKVHEDIIQRICASVSCTKHYK